MQTAEFVQFLLDNRIPVFTSSDAEKVLHKEPAYTKLFLHRCVGKGILGKVERGIYYLKERSNEYEVASSVVKPSYISMVSALYYYGLTTQIPHIMYVVSEKQHRPIEGVLGFKIVFRKVRRRMFFGYHKEGDGNIFIADPEKAIVDIMYFRDVNDLDDDALDRPSRINVGKLVSYAKESGEGYVITGVAKLLYDNGYRPEANRLEKLFM